MIDRKPIIVWDMHGVLFTKSIWHWLYLIVTFPYLSRALWCMSFKGYIIIFKYFLRKVGLYDIEMTSEELIALCKMDNNQDMINLVALVSSDYVPCVATFSLVKEFQKKGFLQYIASNVGQTVFIDFKKKYQDYFIYFENFFTVTFKAGKLLVKKPNPEYFLEFCAENNCSPHDCIFIDDSPDNVKAAQKVGMHGLVFKSAKKLKNDLITLNIF